MIIPKRSVFNLTLAICMVYALNGGVRGNFGVILEPVALSSGLSYSEVSFIFAISQLLFGALQPFFGILALKTSNRTVLVGGMSFMAAGFLLTPFCHEFWSLMLSLGIFFGSGTAAASFALLLATVTPQIPKKSNSTVSGFLNASSGVGTTFFAPILTALSAIFGLLGAMLFLGLPALLLIPVLVWISADSKKISPQKNFSAKNMIRNALKDRRFIFILAGFFTCGFHMAILETHFFTQLTTFGLDRSTSANFFALYGILTLTGSALGGFLCNYLPMNFLLGSIYATRIFLAIAIIFMPKTFLTLTIFIIVLGLTSDSTVSPTAGILLNIFGEIRLPTLFGLAFLTHQVGCFLSAWLGGILIESSANYELLWSLDAILALLAATVSYKIKI